MTTKLRLYKIIDKIIMGRISEDEISQELHELLHAFGDCDYQEKIRTATVWAEIYFCPRKSERYGGPDEVRGSLLAGLTLAARRTSQLREGRQ
jgi:hypothetical protein